MARATAKLEQRNDPKTGSLKQNNVTILIDFTFDGKRLWLQTGQHIDRKFWDNKNHRVKPNVNGSVEINSIISTISDKINKVYREAILEGKIPTSSYLRNCFDNNNVKNKKTFLQHYDDFIEGYKLTASAGTVKKLKTKKQHLIDFSKQYHVSLDFDSIDITFFNKYIEYFQNTLKHNDSTIAGSIKVLKWFMNYCSKMGYNSNYIYKSFIYKSYDPEIIALTGDELMALYNLELKNECYNQVRDCFCFMCFSALRYSDAKNVKLTDISEKFINITSIKTKSTVSIPLIEETKLLLNKYKGLLGNTAMPFISNQKMNKYLKEVGKLAGLDRPITKVSYRGSRPTTTIHKLYDVLTCHIGRKTFVSYMFNKNIDSELIRSISNHKSISSFSRYNKIDENYKASQMQIAFKKVS